MPSNLTRGLAAVTLVVTVGAGLSACGDGSDDQSQGQPGASQTADNGDVFNDADVAFATDMIPHHAQALEMVDLTEGRPLDPEVQALATEIRGAQAPEVEQMTGWLEDWGQDVPATMDHGDAGHDMGDMGDMGGMSGMMSADEMSELEAASDADFQDLWLRMMIEHHTGAVEMARTEQRDGTFADAVALAGSIVTSQQAEIDRMNELQG